MLYEVIFYQIKGDQDTYLGSTF